MEPEWLQFREAVVHKVYDSGQYSHCYTIEVNIVQYELIISEKKGSRRSYIHKT